MSLLDLVTSSEELAIIEDKTQISYNQLIKTSIFIGQELEKNNCTKKDLVAILLPKSSLYISTILGVNHIQASWLMLDHEQSITRNSSIISQARPRFVIAKSGDMLPENYQLIKTTPWGSIFGNTWESTKMPKKQLYVVYTSGSTGTPKGIMLKAKHLYKMAISQISVLNINNAKTSWFLSPGFDASLSDIFVSLYSHSCLFIPNHPITQIKKIHNFLNNNQISYIDWPPKMMDLLNINKLPYLKTILFGGEISHFDIQKFLIRGLRMVNSYGPSEATVSTSMNVISNDQERLWGQDIGTPLSGVKYAIEPSGELKIISKQVGLGYLDDKKQTKNKFKKNTFYTGDLVEYINGRYIYKSRIDRQFKHNGILICPEEIEINTVNAGVKWAKCQLEDGKIHLKYSGDKTTAEIRQHLNQVLPKSMMPNFITQDTNNIKIKGI